MSKSLVKPPDPLALAEMTTAGSTLRMRKEDKERRNRHDRYKRFCAHAEEASFALDKCSEVARVPWHTVQEWMGDRDFVDIWARTRLRLTERMFGTGVEMALGKTITNEYPDGSSNTVVVPPDGAQLRFYQSALDPRFAKKATVQHTGVIDVQVHSALSQMSDAEKRAEIMRLLEEAPMTIEAQACGD